MIPYRVRQLRASALNSSCGKLPPGGDSPDRFFSRDRSVTCSTTNAFPLQRTGEMNKAFLFFMGLPLVSSALMTIYMSKSIRTKYKTVKKPR